MKRNHTSSVNCHLNEDTALKHFSSETAGRQWHLVLGQVRLETERETTDAVDL